MRAIHVLAVCLALSIPIPHLLGCGQTPPRLPEGHGQLEPEMSGLDAFMETFHNLGSFQLTTPQMAMLTEVQQHLWFAREIRENTIMGYTEKDALYNRILAQRELVELLENHMPDLIDMDLTKGGVGHDAMQPIPLPTLEGAVFYRVITGPGPATFSTRSINLKRTDEQLPVKLIVPESGTTYFMLTFTEVPSDLSRMVVTFAHEGNDEILYWTGLSIDAPDSGQFGLNITDENGESTPALVRLTHKASGKLWAPPNAVDLWPIMTSVRVFPQTETVQPYMHYFLSMKLRGQYWIVPGSFDVALPEGEWELAIVHGTEYEPVFMDFTVTADDWTRKTIQLKRWVDMPARGWYSGDDHIHAKMMTSEDADSIMAFVRAADIKVANILEMGDAGRTFYEQRGFGKGYRFEQAGHVLVPGQEDPRSQFGHVIGMNLTSLARDLDKYYLNDWVADEIHRQGGLYGHTHVGEGGLGVHRDMTLLMPRGLSDFASIMQNILGTERYYEFLNLGFKLTASAGGDAPYGGAVGITRVYAYIGEDTPFSADAWFDAVKKGHTFVTNGPMLDMRVDGTLPGDEIVMTKPRPVRVVASASGLAGFSAPSSFELVRNGDVIKELRPEPGQTELTIDLEVDPGNGCWIAVRATGMDGTQSHTTPVYIYREGFRHWSIEKADALIEKRMGTLDEIEELVRSNVEKHESGRMSHLEFDNLLMVEQSEEILERAKMARGLYEDLRATLKVEQNAGS